MNSLRSFFGARAHPEYFRKWAPTIVILLMWTSGARADFDAKIGTNLRSYPLSGVMEGEIGSDQLLWGDPNSVWYGYAREGLYGSTAWTYNSLAPSVEIFPISFLGVRAGGESIQNDRKYSAYDCDKAQCLGRFYRRFFEAELLAGWGPIFLQAQWRRENWHQTSPQDLAFIEPTSGLALAAGGDTETIYQGILGWKMDESWSWLAGLRYAESANARGFSQMPFGMCRYHSGAFAIGAGAGAFRSTIKDRQVTALFFAEWTFAPSLALH